MSGHDLGHAGPEFTQGTGIPAFGHVQTLWRSFGGSITFTPVILSEARLGGRSRKTPRL